MTTGINDDLLDKAVSRLQIGQTADEILDAYPAQADDLQPLLQAAEAMQTVRSVEIPFTESLLSDRNDFLAKVTELQLQPVSPSLLVRLKSWISQKTARPSPALNGVQKETRNMSFLALKAALILAVAFSSLGGTLAVAADSLPGAVVYPLKLAMEDVRLSLTQDSFVQATMHLEFAQERIQEMVRIAARDDVPEEELLTRIQSHMSTAFQITALASNEEMRELLTQGQTIAMASRSDLELAQEKAQVQIQERLQEASSMMAQWQRETENGLADPEYFRWLYGPGEPPCEGDDCQPPYGDGDQEQNQNQNGPGEPPCEGDDCQPSYGNDDQEQNQNQNGPGEPPCEGDDCQPPYGDSDPEQNQHQHRPGDTPCEGDDCQSPRGDSDQEQNQNTEQNQGQGATQNQDQESNGQGAGSSQSSGSGDPAGSGSSENSNVSGGTGSGGGPGGGG